MQLGNRVFEIQREIDVLCAQQAELLAEWDSLREWESDGSRSAASRYARETGLSVADARGLLHRSRRLTSMPLTAEAFASGELSSSRVDLLVRANRPEVSDQFQRDEETILSSIEPLSFGDAHKAVRYWSQHADAVGAEDRTTKLFEQRNAQVSKTFEGSLDVRALFDPVNGEIFANELERIDKELFEADWQVARSEHGDNVRVEHLARSASQRRCDALVEMAKRSAGSTTSSIPRPLISVMVDYGSFQTICETAGGTVLTPGQVIPLLETADIERIVFDGGSRVIDVSRKRLFKGAVRRAIEARDRHCQDLSGCDVPAWRCDVDHELAYTAGGMTEQSNGRLLCPKHNRGKGSGPPQGVRN